MLADDDSYPGSMHLSRRRTPVGRVFATVWLAQREELGDFGDLQRTVQILAAYGADFVGLNPLHALYLDSASHISPYSPSSRVYINALYLHLESMNDFDACEQARSMVADVEFQSALAALRHSELVDYPGVGIKTG